MGILNRTMRIIKFLIVFAIILVGSIGCKKDMKIAEDPVIFKEVIDYLAAKGFDPQYGARPVK